MRGLPTTCIYGIYVFSLFPALQARKQFMGLGQPPLAEWQSLNASLNGHLQTIRPWAAVCYSSDPLFDPTKCQEVGAHYGNDTIRVRQPSALMWPSWEACGNGHGCGLNLRDPQVVYGAACEQGTTPSYSVAITSAEEASTVVKWAVANDVILTIKSTGHDLLGRSNGPDTLQVNVARLQHLEYVPEFVPEGSQDSPVSAITMGGGVQMSDLAKLALRENVSVVLGSCETIGAGGFFLAGGHGTSTPTLGLGVDTVLQYEIITADGTIRTINAVRDPDLFWAVRGGGPNWGIITSITIQTFPNMEVSGSEILLQPNPSQNRTELTIQLMELHGKYQNMLLDAGLSTNLMLNKTYLLTYLWPAANDSLPLLFPFFDELKSLSDNYTVVSNNTGVPFFNSYGEQQLQFGPADDAVGYPGAGMQSATRIIPRSFLTSSESIRKVAEAIWAAYETMAAAIGNSGNTNRFVVPPIIGGNLPGVRNFHRVNETGANPALYEGAWLIVLASVWQESVTDEMFDTYVSGIAHSTDALTELGIIGSYQGEANPNERNWQEAYFGYKYSNLTNIKRKYDPTNFFNTWQGVDFVQNRTSYQCYKENAPFFPWN